MPSVKGTVSNIQKFEKDGKLRFVVSVLEKFKSGKQLISDVTIWDKIDGVKMGDAVEFEVKGAAFTSKKGFSIAQLIAV